MQNHPVGIRQVTGRRVRAGLPSGRRMLTLLCALLVFHVPVRAEGGTAERRAAEPDVTVILGLEDAIRLGLERNFGILIARNRAEIATLNRNPGSAGMLPRIDAQAGLTTSRESQLISQGGVTVTDGPVQTSALNAELALGWTVFDGLKMFATHEKLREFEQLGELQTRLEVEQTIRDIIISYYNIVRLSKQLAVLQNTVEISEERYRIAVTKRQIGTGSEYEVLLARTDLNSDRAAVVRQEVDLFDARMVLVRLLNLDPAAGIEVDPSIELVREFVLADILESITANNVQLESVQVQQRIAGLERQELIRGRLPQVDIGAGLYLNQRETSRTVVQRQEFDGVRYGLTVRLPIADGFNLNRKLQAARIHEKNIRLAADEHEKFLETMAYTEYRNYQSTMQVVQIEMENLELANQTLRIALERFYLGTITSLELRESQRTLINTETRLISAQFLAKVSETELLRMMGRLALSQ